MADVADANGVGLVLAGRERAEALDIGILDVVQGLGGRIQGVGFAVAGLAEHAAMVGLTVDEFAEQSGPGLGSRVGSGIMARKHRVDACCRVVAGGEGGLLPGLGQLAGCHTLVQVAVAVGAPDGGLPLVGATVTVDVVAGVAVIAVAGDVRVVLGQHHLVLGVKAVQHIGEGVFGNPYVGAGKAGTRKNLVVRPYLGKAWGGAFTHGRVPVTPGAANRSANAVAIRVDVGEVDLAGVLAVQFAQVLEGAGRSCRVAVGSGQFQVAGAAAAEGHRHNRAGAGHNLACGVLDGDEGRQERIAVGTAKRIGHDILAGLGGNRIGGDTGGDEGIGGSVIFHRAGDAIASKPHHLAVHHRFVAWEHLWRVGDPLAEIGIGLQEGVGLFRQGVADGQARIDDTRVFTAGSDHLGPDGVVGWEEQESCKGGTGTVHAQIVVGNDLVGGHRRGGKDGRGSDCRQRS